MAIHGSGFGIAEILITDQLEKRVGKRPRAAEENRTMRELIQAMAHGSAEVLNTVTQMALRLCKAGSTGVSLLEQGTGGDQVFHWVALAGKYAAHAGGMRLGTSAPAASAWISGGPCCSPIQGVCSGI
jgi:hypothetical protein